MAKNRKRFDFGELGIYFFGITVLNFWNILIPLIPANEKSNFIGINVGDD